MKIEIVKKETIKPSSPTPFNLKTYTLSVLDQVAVSNYTPLVFTYPNAYNDDHFSRNLKNSLSNTLTIFPPIAGRIKDNVSVDCNDEGVICYETRVYSTLAQLLPRGDIECLKRLLVVGDDVNVDTGAQLLVQINFFDCGGIALGLSFSHKLCDAATFATFLKSWSANALMSDKVTVVPDLTAGSATFPPGHDVSIVRLYTSPVPPESLAITRIVFDGPNVTALKIKSASQITPRPTRVEAVTALIGKCAVSASNSSRKSGGPCVFIHTINLRKSLVPPLAETAFGNIISVYEVNLEQHRYDTSLDVLVTEFRKGRTEYCDSLALRGRGGKIGDEAVEAIEMANLLDNAGTGAAEMHIFTSWCRFGLYEVDFGTGGPIWIGIPMEAYKNSTLLMDTKDGNGIEVYVCLLREEMDLFQADPLLLHYASAMYLAA